MYHILIFLLSFTAMANDLEVCTEHTKTVLKRAFTEVSNDEINPYRFVEDEAAAVGFIKAYDPRKLGMNIQIKNAALERKECKFLMEKEHQLTFCDSLFQNYNFMKALIHGMKNYGWKNETLALGREQVLRYAHRNTAPGLPLINLGMTFYTLRDLAGMPGSAFDVKEINSVIKNFERESERLSKEVKAEKHKDCKIMQEKMQEEVKVAAVFSRRLKDLLKSASAKKK